MSGQFKQFLQIMTISLLIAVLFIGCAGQGTEDTVKSEGESQANQQAPVVDTKPVTLKIFGTVPLPDEDFQLLFVEPLKKKYPNITLENLTNGKNNINNLIASNQTPDILIGTNTYAQQAKELGLSFDITSLLKKHNIDLNRFESYIIDGFKSESGELYAIPYSVNSNVTYYNKDLFDKFGVPYPKDGMYWEDAIELAKKLTRTDGGVQYRGLDAETTNRLSAVLSLTAVDAKKERASVNTPQWRTVFETLHTIYSIPGNAPPSFTQGTLAVEPIFMKDRTIAMFPTVTGVLTRIADATANGLNWDMAQYPSLKERPDTYMYLDAHGLYITGTSPYKDQAMQVIATVTSDDVQTISSRQRMRITTLKNNQIKQQFAADIGFMKGKHIESIFKGKPAPAPLISKYNAKAQGIVNKYYTEYMKGSFDVNTALLKADEDINKMIDTEK